MSYKCEIPLKLPSLNEYIGACRSNAYVGANMKKLYQDQIGWMIKRMPRFNKPIYIHFHWIEGNHKRDLDNISFAKKFILDAMQEGGKIPNDNSNYIKGFTDTFEYQKEFKVILEITEVEDDTKGKNN